jgi:hypothetical protein
VVLDDVMGGRSNRVHLDAAAVKLDPPLSVVHAAEKLSGVGDCYDGGRLSLTGFFQLWAVALDGLATEVCRSSSQSQAKTDEVATLVHRHRKCVAVLSTSCCLSAILLWCTATAPCTWPRPPALTMRTCSGLHQVLGSGARASL